jgi:hypothetical protein
MQDYSWRSAYPLDLAEAVAQTRGPGDFLCMCDKMWIPRRVISVSEGPHRPAEALL